MKLSTFPCPDCFRPISFFQIITAPTPFHIICPRCGARLRCQGHPAVWVGLLLSVLAGAAIAGGLLTMIIGKRLSLASFSIWFGSSMLIFLGVESLIYWFHVYFGIGLERRKQPEKVQKPY